MSRIAGRLRRAFRPWLLIACALAVPATGSAAPASGAGTVEGQVVNGLARPIQGAWVSFDFEDATVLHRQVQTDASGRFVMAGLPSGRYAVSAQADDLTAQTYDVIVTAGQIVTVAFQLVIDPAAMYRKHLAEEQARQQLVADGIRLDASGNHDQAIERFRQAIGISADCAVCFFNLGRAQAGKHDAAAAEASFRQAITLDPGYAEAYASLASLYNGERDFARAVQAGAKAAELSARLGPSIASGYRYNEGVYLWNAGEAAKAMLAFEAAIQLDRQNENAHFQLALACINQGQLERAATELQTYLSLAPEGAYAARARSLLASLRK
jgi:tetratricopeptide (TPR) repeat protein